MTHKQTLVDFHSKKPLEYFPRKSTMKISTNINEWTWWLLFYFDDFLFVSIFKNDRRRSYAICI